MFSTNYGAFSFYEKMFFGNNFLLSLFNFELPKRLFESS